MPEADPSGELPAGVEQLIDEGRLAEALARLDKAMSGGEESAALQYRRGYCLLHLGRYADSREALLRARSLDTGSELRFRISVALANLALRTGRYADAARTLQDLLAGGEHSEEEETLLHYSLGQAEFYLGNFSAAVSALKRALDHYRRTDNRRGIVSTLQSLAAAHQLAHGPQPAIVAYQEAYEIAAALGDRQSVGLIYLNLGALYLDRAHWVNARKYFEDALEIMRALGRVPYEVSLLCNLGNLCVRIGQYDRAEERFDQVDALTEGNPELMSYRGYLHLYRAEMHREQGNFEGAARELDRAFEIVAELKNRKDLELVAEERFYLHCARGDVDGAREAYRTAAGLLEGDGDRERSKLVLLEARLALHEEGMRATQRILRELQKAQRFFRTTGYLPLVWEAYSLQGELLLRGGDAAGARESLLRAWDAHQEIRRTLPAEAQASYERRPAVRRFERVCSEAALDKSAVVLLKILEFNKKLNEGFGERGASEFLSDVLDEAIALVHADEGYLLLGEEVQAARNAERQDLSTEVDRALDRIARTLLAEVRRTGKPALVFSSAADPEVAAALRELELVSLLLVPIRARGDVLGTLYLHNRFNRGAFTEENLFLIEGFSDLAGLAIVNSQRLEQALDHRARLHDEVEYLKRELSAERRLISGQSPAFRDALKLARRAARSEASVLLRGETGSGKELLAQEIHTQSNRASGPYVRVNLPAIPHELIESELFGHEPGAFTGAIERKRGLFEIASGGTILLDEIGDLPLPSQVKLLRVLQERRLKPLGGTQEIPIDVRVLAATNRNVEAMLADGTFREDLFYRLNVVSVNVPALRERREDILPLARHFLGVYARQVAKNFTGFSAAARKRLLDYSWPGNVRELENLVQRAVLLEEGPELELAEVGGTPLPIEEQTDGVEAYRRRVNQARAESIREALATTNGNKSKAARMLGLSRSRFYELLDELQIEKS